MPPVVNNYQIRQIKFSDILTALRQCGKGSTPRNWSQASLVTTGHKAGHNVGHSWVISNGFITLK